MKRSCARFPAQLVRWVFSFVFVCFWSALAPLRRQDFHLERSALGVTFRGETLEVLGPGAIFRAGSLGGKRVLLRGLSQEDCRRIYDEISLRPARAENWAAAQGAATSDLVGHVLQLQDKALIPAGSRPYSRTAAFVGFVWFAQRQRVVADVGR